MLGVVPEELEGIMTAEQWSAFSNEQLVQLGKCQVRCLQRHIGFMETIYPGRHPITVQSISDGGTGRHVQAIYAVLQLVVRDPAYLLEEFHKINGDNAVAGYVRIRL